ncbi:hypothetical protein [Oceanobacillus sp. 1P07AA]|uniref:hypothetical protein n=1 Tax=Oceanobacillus sp. 1P07AA TaxID=3132293 RepID=UPI0039A61109
MHPFKKLLLSILIILVFISIFQDLSHINDNYSTEPNFQNQQFNYNIIPIKVMPGDTVLSIIESLHQGRTQEIEIELLLKEFQQLNPTTEPTDIRVDHIYYFPLEKQ